MKTVFQNVWVVTENAARDVLQNGTVAVSYTHLTLPTIRLV